MVRRIVRRSHSNMGEGIFKGRISTKGQLVIPKPLRTAYRLKEGGSVIMVPERHGVLVKPATYSAGS